MWFTIGFGTAIALAAYLLSGIWLLAAVLLLIPPLIVCLIWKRLACKVISALLLGCIAGFLYYAVFDCLLLSDIRAYDGTEQKVSIEATDYAFESGYGSAVDGKLQLQGRSYAVRLYYHDELEVKPGDVLQGIVRLRYTPAGGIQTTTYHKGEGIFLLAYAMDAMEHIPEDAVPAKYFAAELRETICQRISEIFPEDTAAFSKALLLGDDSEISYGDDIAFQKSGIRHVIAVSGLHVSILFSIVYFVVRRKIFLTMLIGYPVLLLFCAVAGFTPSVVRACIMQALIILSMNVSKEYDQGTSLAFAALVILCINPFAITSVSFQLSVGSMIGIFLFSGRISQYVLSRKIFRKVDHKSKTGRRISFLVKSVSVTLGAMIVTLPLCAVYFGMVSVISVVTNLLTLWAVSYVFYGIMAACLLSLLWMPAGMFLGWLVSWPIRYILLTANILSAIPGGVAYTDSPYTVLWIICALGLILLYFLCKRKSPALLASAIAFLYMLSLVATWAEPYLDTVRMTVLDVGQGQCVLLQSRDSAYLLDCGGSSPKNVADAAICAMGAQGIQSLDGVILTHYDKDHANGTAYLLQAVPVDRLYLPNTQRDNTIRMELESMGVPITWITQTQKLSCGSGELTLFPSLMEDTGNESSMCILYQGEKCAILVTGDRDMEGEQQLLKQGNIPKLDVLVVGHHGAYSATGWELLSQTMPEIAVISVGKDNLHGHPDAYTLDRLERFGCIVRRTDQEGTIIIRG